MNEILKYIIFFLLGFVVYYFLFTNPSVGSRKVIEGFDYTLDIIPTIYIKSGYTTTEQGDDENVTFTLSESDSDNLLSLDSTRSLNLGGSVIESLSSSNLTMSKPESYVPDQPGELSLLTEVDAVRMADYTTSIQLKISATPPILKMIYIPGATANGDAIGIIDSDNFIASVGTNFSGAQDMNLATNTDINSIVNTVNSIITTDNNTRTSDDLSKLRPIGNTLGTNRPFSSDPSFNRETDIMVFGTAASDAIIIELRKDAPNTTFRSIAGINIYILLKDQVLTKTNKTSNNDTNSVISIQDTLINGIINVFNDTTHLVDLGDNSFVVIGLNNLTFGQDAPLKTDILTSYNYNIEGTGVGDGIDYFTSYYLRDLVQSDSDSPSDIVGDSFMRADAAALMLMTSFASTNADGSQSKLQGCLSAPEGYNERCQMYSPEGRYYPKSEESLRDMERTDTCNNQTPETAQAVNTAFGSSPCNESPERHGYSDICCEDRQCSAILLKNPNLCSGKMKLYNAICPPQLSGDDTGCNTHCCGIEIHSYIERLFNDIINFNTINNVRLNNRRINRDHIRNYIYGNLLDLSTYIGNQDFSTFVRNPTSDEISSASPLLAFHSPGSPQSPELVSTSNIISNGDDFFNALDQYIHLGVIDDAKNSNVNSNDTMQIDSTSKKIILDFAVCNGLVDNCGTNSSTPNQANCKLESDVCKSPLDILKTISGSETTNPLPTIILKSDFTDTTLETKFDSLRSGNNLNVILNQGQTHNYTHIINSYKNFINRYVQGNPTDVNEPTDATNLEQDIKESIFSLTLQFRFQTGNPVSPLDAAFPITPGFTDMTYTQFAEAI